MRVFPRENTAKILNLEKLDLTHQGYEGKPSMVV